VEGTTDVSRMGDLLMLSRGAADSEWKECGLGGESFRDKPLRLPIIRTGESAASPESIKT